jgi:hypothetical protein
MKGRGEAVKGGHSIKEPQIYLEEALWNQQAKTEAPSHSLLIYSISLSQQFLREH